jgi:hypothetical protein
MPIKGRRKFLYAAGLGVGITSVKCRAKSY